MQGGPAVLVGQGRACAYCTAGEVTAGTYTRLFLLLWNQSGRDISYRLFGLPTFLGTEMKVPNSPGRPTGLVANQRMGLKQILIRINKDAHTPNIVEHSYQLH